MRQTCKTVYLFKELPDEQAKEKARDWWRQQVFDDNVDYDFVYEDAATAGEIIGIDIRTRPVKLMNGSTRYDPTIYWSGFWSQGDGACYEGSYSYRDGYVAKKGVLKALKAYAPLDTDLHNICKRLSKAQARYFYKLEASIKHRGHYYHSGCMSIEVSHCEDHYRDIDSDTVDEITQCLREFADWIYARLKAEYEYQTSDEVVDEALIANEYEFDEYGSLA